MKTSVISKVVILSVLFAAMFATESVAQIPDRRGSPAPTAMSEGESKPALSAPAAKTSLQWRLGAPVSPWNVSGDRWTELPVSVSDSTKTKKILLTQSTLVNSDSLGNAVLHVNNICLYKERDSNGPCEQELKLAQPEGTTGATKQTIWLKVNDQFTSVGTFTGSLFFDTEPIADTQSIALRVQQTRWWLQALGVGVIIVGVCIAWLVTVFGRSRIARDQALMPALVLLDELRDLQNTADQFAAELKPNVSESTAVINRLINSLSTDALDKRNFLPPVIPAFGPSAARTTDYQTFLTQTSQQVDELNILFSEGLRLLAARWKADLSGPELADLQSAIGKIDHLSGSLPTDAQTLRGQVNVVLQTWNTAHAARAQALGVQAQAIEPAQPGQKSFIAVRLEVRSITILFWLIWGLLSVVIGATMLIVPVPGFGSITDFVRCFLWGFGLPVAGNSIQNLTVGSLNTQLGVSVTRN